MSIQHNSPPELVSLRKRKARAIAMNGGMSWDGHLFQTEQIDRINIAGRAAKLNSLISLGLITLSATSYTDSGGNNRPLVWRTLDNNVVPFTVQSFLEFAIAVDEFVENKYFESW
ncbi:MAG: DUF4376 domain-containing protein [Pseudomonadales bacterium]